MTEIKLPKECLLLHYLPPPPLRAFDHQRGASVSSGTAVGRQVVSLPRPGVDSSWAGAITASNTANPSMPGFANPISYRRSLASIRAGHTFRAWL